MRYVIESLKFSRFFSFFQIFNFEIHLIFFSNLKCMKQHNGILVNAPRSFLSLLRRALACLFFFVLIFGGAFIFD